jgi:hypothetical protein
MSQGVCRVAGYGDRAGLRAVGGQRPSGEGGSAVVEFVYLGVLLLVPLIYLVLMMSRLQAGAFATTQAAREAGRAFVTATSAETAEARAEAAARIAFEDEGFRSATSLVIDCDGLPCLRPEGRVEMTATVTVPLPLVPSFARRLVPLEIPVTARHLSTVDRFRNAP